MRNTSRTYSQKVMRATDRITSSSVQPLKPFDGTRRLLALFLVLTVALAILVQQNFQEISNYLNRPLAKVRMENQWRQVQEDEVRALLSNYLGSGFFSLDVVTVKQELEQLPWVERAAIKKLWPNSLSLSLTEQVAIARWGESSLLNQHGELFQPPDIAAMSMLPYLHGPEGSQRQVMEQYQRISKLLFKSGMRLSGLSLSPRGSWEMQLNDSMVVTLGRADVMSKLERFLDFVQAQPATRVAAFQSVDLRYDNGIAVKSAQEEFAGVAVR